MRFSEYSPCHLVFIRDGERIPGLDHLEVTSDPSAEISGRTSWIGRTHGYTPLVLLQSHILVYTCCPPHLLLSPDLSSLKGGAGQLGVPGMWGDTGASPKRLHDLFRNDTIKDLVDPGPGIVKPAHYAVNGNKPGRITSFHGKYQGPSQVSGSVADGTD